MRRSWPPARASTRLILDLKATPQQPQAAVGTQTYSTPAVQSNRPIPNMILPFHEMLRGRFAETIARIYGIDPSDQPPLVIECPPRRALGDLAVTVAFELARRLRKAPRTIGQELANAIGTMAGIDRFEAAPNGYVNVYLNRQAFVLAQFRQAEITAVPPTGPKTIVEHTAINPNKAAHVGHLRNVALGDSLGRLLRFRGALIEVQNYIDDTGVQVADVVVGFRELDRRDLDGVRQLAWAPQFDYYCWDLYAKVTEWYEEDPSRLQLRAKTLHDIESGDTAAATMAQLVTERIVHCHLATMARLNVAYDLLTWEGDILRLELLGACLRAAEGCRHRVPATHRKARRVLGDAHRRRRGPGNGRRYSRGTDLNPLKRSSSGRTAPSPTSERTSPTSSGSLACSGVTFIIASWPPSPMADLCGPQPRDRARPTLSHRPSVAPMPCTTSSTRGSRISRSCFGSRWPPWDTPSRRSDPSTSPTRWLLLRTRPHARSGMKRPQRIKADRSSRSRDGKG